MGWTEWRLSPRIEEEEEEESDSEQSHPKIPSIATTSREFYTLRGRNQDLEWEKIRIGYDSRILYLESLFVSPQYQGQGVGKALLEWGHRFADRRNLLCHCTATYLGSLLYAKSGWREYGFPRHPNYPEEDYDDWEIELASGERIRQEIWRMKEMFRTPDRRGEGEAGNSKSDTVARGLREGDDQRPIVLERLRNLDLDLWNNGELGTGE